MFEAHTFTVLALLGAVAPVAAQYPAGLAGAVYDAQAGTPIAGATLRVQDRVEESGVDGRFRFPRLLDGMHTLRAERLGYRDTTIVVSLRNGTGTHLRVDLHPSPIRIAGFEVVAERLHAPGTLITRAAVEGAGARTLADAVAGAPGVIVRSSGGGGAATASVRGSAPEAVLVLVDGVPLNDGVSGVADLSRIPAHQIDSVRVLPGAQGARYGPAAQAGVILVWLRRAGVPLGARLGAGSMGTGTIALEAGRHAWSAGVSARRLGGGFRYERPAEIGGGPDVRENADLREVAGTLAGRTDLFSGTVEAQASGSWLERGVPGRSYAPSPAARQHATGARAGLLWRRTGTVRVHAWSALDRTAFRDSAPPAGPDIAESAQLVATGARLDAQTRGAGRITALGGVTISSQRVRASGLDGDRTRSRTDAAAYAGAVFAPALPLRVDALVRADRVTPDDDTHFTHALTVALPLGSVQFTAAHRSSVRPPALADQYMREAVGIAPNPLLRAERVPAEIEVSASTRATVSAVTLGVGTAAYRGDVRGMIVWSPDFRFVWSPRNVDVRRRGGEAWATIELPAANATLSGFYAFASTVYDRPGEPVQLAYRPRHSARVQLTWQPAHWDVALDARWTGPRFPAAAPVNELTGFWTTAALLSRSWTPGSWSLTSAVRVERLFDERASLIFGVPEPGRTWHIELRLAPRSGLHPNGTT